MSARTDPPRHRPAPSVGACLALAVGAALAGLGLRLSTPPSAPPGGAEAAYRQFERVRDGLPPAKARQIEEMWRRMGLAAPPPNP